MKPSFLNTTLEEELKDIGQLIKNIENEIQKTQKGIEKTESLERLKEIYLTYQGDDEIVSSLELAEEIKNEKEEHKIITGWSGLDKIIKGFRLGQVITVSGITKHGKTSWCIDLTNKIPEEKPVWFPMEEGAKELIRKFLERGEEPPIFYTPRSVKIYNLQWIEMKIIESIAKHGSKIIFIDQLDFIVAMSGDDHHLRVGQTMRDLKRLAVKWNIVIVLICHLRKTRLDVNPDLDDLKGSGSIAQESDTVIIIWRETKRINNEVVLSNNTNVSVQANRRYGLTGNIKMVCVDGHYREQDFITEHQAQAEANKAFEESV